MRISQDTSARAPRARSRALVFATAVAATVGGAAASASSCTGKTRVWGCAHFVNGTEWF